MPDYQKNYSRRDFIKNIAAGSALACASSGSLLLSGCSSAIETKQSYLHNRIQSNNISTVYIWTDIILQAVRNKSMTPPFATRALAMGHLAGFLAVNGILNEYNTPYNLADGPHNADIDVAYGVAVSYAISDAFNALFTFDRKRFLDRFPNSEAKTAGIRWGKYVAAQVIKQRTNDGAEPNKSDFYLGRYPRKEGIMGWSPTGPFYQAELGPAFESFERGLYPGWGAIKPWVMKNTLDFRAQDFIDPRSDEFARQYVEVKELGDYNSRTRTEDQKEIAFFWEDGPRGVTPPGHWQLIAMTLTENMNLSVLEQARIFALLSLGQADAAITTWDSKFAHDIARPETMIRFRANQLGNEALNNAQDRNWKSLIPTPNFPTYTSGHSCFSGVSAHLIALCIGTDKVAFSSLSPDTVNWLAHVSNVRRSWTSLWQAAEENGASRIYGGVHWDADNVEGLRIGKNLADYVYKNAFVKKA
tara:strand:+ start:6695 stop:8113 length:1419 start_codon:yes stop_codon:yes gene_type:complete